MQLHNLPEESLIHIWNHVLTIVPNHNLQHLSIFTCQWINPDGFVTGILKTQALLKTLDKTSDKKYFTFIQVGPLMWSDKVEPMHMQLMSEQVCEFRLPLSITALLTFKVAVRLRTQAVAEVITISSLEAFNSHQAGSVFTLSQVQMGWWTFSILPPQPVAGSYS